jgi:hypothetical protein
LIHQFTEGNDVEKLIVYMDSSKVVGGSEVELVCSEYQGKLGFKPSRARLFKPWFDDEDWSWDDEGFRTARATALWNASVMGGACVGEVWKCKIVSQHISDRYDKNGARLVYHTVELLERVTYETDEIFDPETNTWDSWVMSGSVVVEERSTLGSMRQVRYADDILKNQSYLWTEYLIESHGTMVCVIRQKHLDSVQDNSGVKWRAQALGRKLANVAQAALQVPSYPKVPNDGAELEVIR